MLVDQVDLTLLMLQSGRLEHAVHAVQVLLLTMLCTPYHAPILAPAGEVGWT